MQSGRESSVDKQTNLATASPSFTRRLLAMLWRHPAIFRSLLREEYRKKWGIPRDRRAGNGWSGFPVDLNLNLTRRCNLKCRMCTQHRHSADLPHDLTWYDPKQELPLSAWIDLFDQVASFRPRLYLTGGEPTLYRDFPGLLQAAKKRRLPVHLQTNGTRLAELADFLVTQGVEMLTVSLDGPEPIHDLVRGQAGVFQRAAAGITALVAARKRLKEPGPMLLINCVISKANLAILDKMVPLALDLGADILQVQHTIFNSAANVARHNLLMSPHWAQTHGLDLVSPSIPEGEFYESEIGPEDLPLLRKKLAQVRSLAQGRLKLNLLPHIPLNQLEPYYLDLNYPALQACNSLWKSCRILPDGTVSPCLHVVAGKITEQSFREIWSGPRMRNFRQIIARRLLPGCARCCNRSFN
jgi:MoaA/NifB/PqqE/SkfB family radical SAM enzyme